MSRFQLKSLLIKAFDRIFRAKRPFKLTRAGWVFILYTTGVGAGAINTGNNLLYLVFGVFLGLILASGFLSDLSLWGLSVEWKFPYSSEASQPAAVLLLVTNHKKWFPSLCVTLSMEGTLHGINVPLKVYVPYVAAGATASARLEFTPSRRGWFQMKEMRLHTRYPFALLEKWWRVRNRDEKSVEGFFITPATFNFSLGDLPNLALNQISFEQSSDRGDGATFYGIRPYRQGDNPRRIHWKSSAKRSSDLLVREMESERDCDVLVRFPIPAELKNVSDKDLEKMVSFLASLIRECKNEGRRTGAVLSDSLVTGIDEFLSLWEPRKELPPDVARWTARTVDLLINEKMQEVDGLKGFLSWLQSR